MTHAGVEVNVRRLTFFLQSREPVGAFEESVAGLLHVYGRIMDVHGCGTEQLSRLFFTREDFEEIREWAKNKEGFYVNDTLARWEGNRIIKAPRYLRFCHFPYIYHITEIENYLA